MRLQLFKANELKHVRVRRFQVHWQHNAGLQCLIHSRSFLTTKFIEFLEPRVQVSVI